MNLRAFRSGDKTVVHAECVTGYAFILAAAGVESALFTKIAAAFGSSFTTSEAAI